VKPGNERGVNQSAGHQHSPLTLFSPHCKAAWCSPLGAAPHFKLALRHLLCRSAPRAAPRPSPTPTGLVGSVLTGSRRQPPAQQLHTSATLLPMARVFSKAYRSDEPAMTSLARVYAGGGSALLFWSTGGLRCQCSLPTIGRAGLPTATACPPFLAPLCCWTACRRECDQSQGVLGLREPRY